MQTAVLTFDRFNEIDSFVVSNLLNRVPGWRALIAHGNVATTGGCRSAPLIAAWMVARRAGLRGAGHGGDPALPAESG